MKESVMKGDGCVMHKCNKEGMATWVMLVDVKHSMGWQWLRMRDMEKGTMDGGSKHPLPMWNKQSKDDEDDYDSHEQNEIM